MVDQSVTTRIVLKPSDSGNSSTKSLAISWKRHSSVVIGTNFVCLLCLSVLLFEHLTYPAIYFDTSSNYLSYIKLDKTGSWVQYLPWYPATWLSCCWYSTCYLDSCGTIQYPFFFSHVGVSIRPSYTSSTFFSSPTSSFSRSLSCPSSKKYAYISHFSST